jgi:hypothetical protein
MVLLALIVSSGCFTIPIYHSLKIAAIPDRIIICPEALSAKLEYGIGISQHPGFVLNTHLKKPAPEGAGIGSVWLLFVVFIVAVIRVAVAIMGIDRLFRYGYSGAFQRRGARAVLYGDNYLVRALNGRNKAEIG